MTWRRRALLLVLMGLAVTVGLAAPAGATGNTDYTVPPPTTVVTTPPAARQPVATAVRVRPVTTRLAITGSETTTLAVLGLALVGGGAAVLVARRRVAA